MFEFDAQASERVANRFLEKYDAMQIQFLRALKKIWDVPLDEAAVRSDEFRNFVAAFGIAHADFPVSDALAKHRPGDASDDDVRRETASQLREHERYYIIAAPTPSQSSADHSEYWLFTKGAGLETPALAELRSNAHALPVKSIRSITEVERSLAESLPDHPGEWRAFAAGFLEPNLFFDGPLTEATRHEATNALIVYQKLAAAENVIEMGHPVSRTQAAALMQLTQHCATVSEQRGPAHLRLIGLGLGSVLGGAWVRRQSRRAAALVPVSELRRREPNLELDQLRSGLLNPMSRWLKEKFVSRLIDERNDALANQSQASAKVDQMNIRLNTLKPEIQQRIASCEKRIKALERELVESNAMNKELIRARIQMARKKLEIEKARSNLSWN